MIDVALALLRICRSGLLLLILLEPLIASAHSAGQSAHRRFCGCTRARVAGYRAANRSKCGASRGASRDVPLRRQWLIRYRVRIRPGGLTSAGIKTGLFDRP
jgi:hypothetical protein